MDFQAITLAMEAQISDNAQRVIKKSFILAPLPMKEEKEKELPGSGFDTEPELSRLIRRSKEGDSLAMEAIYEQYKRPLFSLAYRYTYDSATSEDLLQEIFIKVFTHLKDIQTAETFPSWIYRIAINTCYSYLRQKKIQIQKIVPLSEVEAKIDESKQDSHHLYLKKSLDEAIEALPKRSKSIFLLHDVQGFKHEEIARMLGCSIGSSKSQLFKARLRIRNHLKSKKIYEGGRT